LANAVSPKTGAALIVPKGATSNSKIKQVSTRIDSLIVLKKTNTFLAGIDFTFVCY